MGIATPLGMPTLEDIEPWNVPEFFMTSIGRTEVIEGSGCVRVYCGTQRSKRFHAEFSIVVPLALLPDLRKAVDAAIVSPALAEMTAALIPN